MMDSLKKSFAALPAEATSERQKIAAAWDSIVNKQINFSKDFILKHAISPASYYALYQKFDQDNFILNPDNDLQSNKVVATTIKAIYPASLNTKANLNQMDQINKAIKNMKIKK